MDDGPLVPVRFPRPADSRLPFRPAGALAGRVSLRELLDHHDPESGRYTLVADLAGELAGVATVTASGDALHVDFLVRNAECPRAAGLRVGRPLLRTAEALAAKSKKAAITLESVDDPRTLDFYAKAGFEVAGAPVWEAEWGIIHPMRKVVLPRP